MLVHLVPQLRSPKLFSRDENKVVLTKTVFGDHPESLD